MIGGNLAFGVGDGELTNQHPAWKILLEFAGNTVGNLVGNAAGNLVGNSVGNLVENAVGNLVANGLENA